MKKIFFHGLFLFLLVSCQKTISNTVTPPLPAQTLTDVSYGSDAAQKMDLYLPAGRTDTTKLIILVHGGAWYQGDKSDFTVYVSSLQQRLPGYAVANIDYRLATVATNHFPAQENDVQAAVNFLIQKSSDYHIGQKIVLLGASAGGHLVLLQAYKHYLPQIKAVVDFFGPTNMTALYKETTDPSLLSVFQLLMNGSPSTDPALYQQSSPINYVSAQSPPTIILHGGIDPLVNISESDSLNAKLQRFGVISQMIVYPAEGHGWTGATLDDSFNKIQAFLTANVH